MKLYQKRKDGPLAALCTLGCYALFPPALLILLIEQACETVRDECRGVPGPRETYRDFLGEMSYRRAKREAKRKRLL
ncbi:hypothetical protein [Cupriavidus taiwanensis]|uniref:hypothetical protein n=1 Tax=Cupriavidus taiwanensis TaxID=164546 RepID=UPI000E1091E9|nr:hypothetical protein [Cupriavidus taiwanensis]SPA50586.1 exported protein of unknown function [Cupriavidus taiwanensis]